MHRYDQNCMSVWKIARNLKLAIRLKLLRPESNSKYLGLKVLLYHVRILSSGEELLSQHFPPSWPGGSGRLWIRNGYNVVVYDRSMKMDGPCAMYRCMTDGKLENVSFFFGFFALVGLLPAGVMYNFLISVVSIFIRQ